MTIVTASQPTQHTGEKMTFKQPLPLLMQTFSGYGEDDKSQDFFFELVPYFTRSLATRGEVLWTQGDQPDGLYIIESGCLKATYRYEDQTELLVETMVALTIAGELTALSGAARNATVVADRETKLWRLTLSNFEKLHTEKPDIAREFTKLVLKGKSPWS